MKGLVGIRGHRGAGKDSVAFLLASTLEFLYCNQNEYNEAHMNQLYHQLYVDTVRDLVEDKDKTFSTADFTHVYLDAFGDTPKAMVQQLLGCDFKYLWDEYWKDHAVVDLKTFNIEEVDKLPVDLKTPDEMKNYVPSCFEKWEEPIKMSLRDFIIYFGITVMQKYFGQDVWVKSTAQNDKMNEEYFESGIRIYTDIKAPTELSYLIDKQAVIINVERKGYKKKGGLDLLKDDNRWTYNIQIKGNDLLSIEDDIWKISKEIFKES